MTFDDVQSSLKTNVGRPQAGRPHAGDRGQPYAAAMRWDRLFGELEGHAEHARLEERDALVADLREGEWAERTWVDGLAGSSAAVEIAVRDVGVLAGHVCWATAQLIRLETASANYVIASSAVQWVRGADRASGLRESSVRAQLGWGPIL